MYSKLVAQSVCSGDAKSLDLLSPSPARALVRRIYICVEELALAKTLARDYGLGSTGCDVFLGISCFGFSLYGDRKEREKEGMK